MKRKSTIFIVFFLGVAILLYPHVAQLTHSHYQNKQVQDFIEKFQPIKISRAEIGDVEEMNRVKEIDDVIEQAKSCNEEIYDVSTGYRDPFRESEGKLQYFERCSQFSDKEMFAAIEIPKLNLVTPLYLGASQEVLSKGVGQVEGSSLPIGGANTHTVLAGHRGMVTKAMFRDLDQLESGDLFYIHTMKETLTYKVYKQNVIYPDETESLQIEQNKDLATLITCHPFRHNYQRLLIHGERIE